MKRLSSPERSQILDGAFPCLCDCRMRKKVTFVLQATLVLTQVFVSAPGKGFIVIFPHLYHYPLYIFTHTRYLPLPLPAIPTNQSPTDCVIFTLLPSLGLLPTHFDSFLPSQRILSTCVSYIYRYIQCIYNVNMDFACERMCDACISESGSIINDTSRTRRVSLDLHKQAEPPVPWGVMYGARLLLVPSTLLPMTRHFSLQQTNVFGSWKKPRKAKILTKIKQRKPEDNRSPQSQGVRTWPTSGWPIIWRNTPLQLSAHYATVQWAETSHCSQWLFWFSTH